MSIWTSIPLHFQCVWDLWLRPVPRASSLACRCPATAVLSDKRDASFLFVFHLSHMSFLIHLMSLHSHFNSSLSSAVGASYVHRLLMNYVFIHVSRRKENVWLVSLLGRIVLEVTEVGHGLAGRVIFCLKMYHIATACHLSPIVYHEPCAAS